MASHAVRTLRSLTPIAEAPGSSDAELELLCGCVIRRRLSADRLVETASGEVLAVGKYPCPAGHTVRDALARQAAER